MKLNISPKIGQKLAQKHQVTELDILECFSNRTAGFLEDPREEHKTDPVTLWFIAETNRGVRLKIVFMQKDGVTIKSAFPPNANEERIYKKYAPNT